MLDNRWVVADWGLGRRPRGQTTTPGRTGAGESFGTLGYAAPELQTDAHAATPQTDIFGIGQIIGWALLQTEPRANVPHLPAPGPWRRVVEAATQQDPDQRPATVDDLLALIVAEFDPAHRADVTRHPRPTADLQPGVPHQRITIAGPAGDLGFSQEANVLVDATIELLRADDDIPIRRLLGTAIPEARGIYRQNEDLQAIDQILDRLTCLAAAFLDLERAGWFTRTVDVLVGIYGIAFENEAETINTPPIPAAQLWLATSTRARALGGLAVRREDWASVAYLASRKAPGMHPIYATWFKHATTMANRRELLTTTNGTHEREVFVLMLALDVIRRLDHLRPELEAEDDRLLTSLAQFDFLACLHAIHTSGATTDAGGIFYPHFATFYAARTQPIVRRLLTDPSLRECIYPRDDGQLADALKLVDQYATHVGFRYDGWEGYTADVVSFIHSRSAS
jgi:hypothetical protein